MTVPLDSTSGSDGNWIFKNKDDGKTSASASLVCLFLRDRLTRSVHILELENCNTNSLFSNAQGMISLWNVEALDELDKYYTSSDKRVRAGALLSVGILNCGIKSDFDPVSQISFSVFLGNSLHIYSSYSPWTFLSQALALLEEYIDNEDSSVRICAIMGIGIAYAGSQKDQVMKISTLPTVLC